MSGMQRARAPQLQLYPERPDPKPGKLDGLLHFAEAMVIAPLARRRGRRLFRIVPRVRALAAGLETLPLPALRARVRDAAIGVRRPCFQADAADA